MSNKAEEYFRSRPVRERRLDCEYECAICGLPFTSHFNLHEGHWLEWLGAWCCDNCWDGNADGFVLDEKIAGMLREKGLPIPRLNARGWVIRD